MNQELDQCCNLSERGVMRAIYGVANKLMLCFFVYNDFWDWTPILIPLVHWCCFCLTVTSTIQSIEKYENNSISVQLTSSVKSIFASRLTTLLSASPTGSVPWTAIPNCCCGLSAFWGTSVFTSLVRSLMCSVHQKPNTTMFTSLD